MVLPGLEEKKLTRGILDGSKNSQEDHLILRSQGYETIGMVIGIGKNPAKEEGTKRRNGRSPVSALMTGLGIVIIERIDTTEIVTETETGRGRETGVVTVTEHVIAVESEVVIMSVTEKEIVIGNEIVIALVKGRGTGIMKLVILTVGIHEIGKLKRTMIMLTRRMIVGGMNSLSTMNIVGVMPRVNTTVINIMTMIMIDMIRWRRMITIMTGQHLNHVKGIELEMWTVTIDAQRGHFPVSTITKKVTH